MGRELPWDDLKIAFGVPSEGTLWDAVDKKRIVLPNGWELCETDNSGARSVVVFRVAGIPDPADAYKVKAQLRRFCR